MRCDNFLELYNELLPFIKRQTTVMRAPVQVERQVALNLYYPSDKGRLRKTANAFGLSRASVSVTIRKVTTAISLHIGSKYIKLPFTKDAVLDKVAKFHEAFAFPQCLGAIDCYLLE